LYQSGDKFPVDLDDIWMLVYSERGKAVRALKETFLENEDYSTFAQNGKTATGGYKKVGYKLSTSCMEYLIARKVREVFDVYRTVFKMVATGAVKVQQFNIPKNYPEALRELADQVERNEQLALENKQQSEKIRQDAPKVTYFEAFMQAAHGSKSVGIREVVKQAHIKSEKKFILWMLDKRILFRQKRDNRLQPYAEYTSCFDAVDFHDDANDYSGKQLLMNPFGKMNIVKRYHDEQPLEFDNPRDMFAGSSIVLA